MAAVCVRHSDVSGVWASLGCKCLFASVGGALALAVVLVWDGACEGEGRTRHLTLQKVLRSSLVIGRCGQLASCVLSLAKRGAVRSLS